jgi:Fe-S-cluster-containing hydrogenase component 2
VVICPTCFFALGTTNNCVVSCPSSPVQLFGDPTMRACVSSCPSRALLFDDTTTNMCNHPNPFFGISSQQHDLFAQLSNFYTSTVNSMCVTYCPSLYFSYLPTSAASQSVQNKLYFPNPQTTPAPCVQPPV